ncbi:undecaprenyl/decaprenyl-phosphate alpha-N-acetylglucosaminyl 1-phosphate transferase [Chitinophagaceae bacterium LB-8]|uniref:Undecaprenyl/decaprenyl-phosphate alpha-N-acetylglucosaminyl 1-phosphate transferase n=1 Tax=Paraflavisolibacter caeni TaxID=2982496 RepID=A0A9X2XND6_9BACT|nr:MraY family glycosyltransferase [Paraflavisolibacter caeni]MCU7547934.1 undecaprenyl/decaprenyl-phosphate alpha-N-acetylglucosaminyl 1-phosphate transferase [Paraflavisolibacter caeni]
MIFVLLTLSVSFILTYLAIPAIIKIANEKRLYDMPDDRKIHKKPIASLGGVGIFIGFFLSTLFFISNKTNPEFQYFFAAATIIFFLGLKDDILILSARKKFICQLAVAAILVHLGGIRIDSMHGILGFTKLPDIIGFGLSYFTIILIINAYNLIDGVDGLAGMLGLLSMVVFGTYFHLAGLPSFSLLAFAMAGSLIGFLIFNFHPAKIFMGDSGSLMIGLLNSILVIKFINVADSVAVPFHLESAVGIGIAVLMVPILDTLRVFSIRIYKGRSPFSPDRNHIHHLLLDRGLNHKYVTACCFLLNVLFISLAYFGRLLGPNFLLCILGAASLGFLAILLYGKKPKAKKINKQVPALQPNVRSISRTKVISLEPEKVAVDQ